MSPFRGPRLMKARGPMSPRVCGSPTRARTREAGRSRILQDHGIADIDSHILLQFAAAVDLGGCAHGALNRVALLQFCQPGQPLGEGTAAKGGRGEESAGGGAPRVRARGLAENWPKSVRADIIRAVFRCGKVRIALSELNPSNFTEAGDPAALFRLWLEEASGGGDQRSGGDGAGDGRRKRIA